MLALLWWLLTGGEPASWVIGAPAVLAAAAASLAMRPAASSRPRLAGLARFVPFFVWRSLTGSLDVAWRALQPRLPITPTLEQYVLRLPPEGRSRVFFASVLNLLPGTLSAELGDHQITVHVLNDGATALLRLRELEDRVADLFGCELDALSPEAAHE